jgi:hypothetical protein
MSRVNVASTPSRLPPSETAVEKQGSRVLKNKFFFLLFFSENFFIFFLSKSGWCLLLIFCSSTRGKLNNKTFSSEKKSFFEKKNSEKIIFFRRLASTRVLCGDSRPLKRPYRSQDVGVVVGVRRPRVDVAPDR